MAITLKKKEKDEMDVAKTYYSIISSMGDFHLTEREVQLMAYTAIKGNISYGDNKKEFCSLYESSFPTINNIISKLKRKKILVKDNGKVKVNPSLLMDFKKPVSFNIVLTNG